VLQPAHFERAKVEGRTTVDAHPQARLRAVRIDLGAAVGDARRGVALRTHRIEQRLLGAIPVPLAEGLTHRQAPAGTQQLEIGLAAGVGGGDLAGEQDLDRTDLGARPGIDLQPPVLRIATVKTHARREVTLGREQARDLATRTPGHRHAVGRLFGQRAHLLSQQAHVLFEQRAHCIGCFETHRERVLRHRAGGRDQQRERRQRATQAGDSARPHADQTPS